MNEEIEVSMDDFIEVDSVYSEENKPVHEQSTTPQTAAIAGKYSVKQVGSLAFFCEPLNGNAPIETAVRHFEQTKANALPVEENDHVIGVIPRDAVDKSKNSFWSNFSSSKIIDRTTRIDGSLRAEDYIDAVMDEAWDITNKYGSKYFPVYERKAFYGLISYEDFISRTREIRDQDLGKAAAIQKSFFPDEETLKSLPYKMTFWNKMANPLGGDMVIAYKISEEKSLVCCADVSGKNVAASLLTMVFSSFFSVLPLTCKEVSNPVKIISLLDKFLERVVPSGNFITCALCYVDSQDKKFALFNCGHTECYLTVKDNGKYKVAPLPAKLPPLGMGAASQELSNQDKKLYYGFSIKEGFHLNLYSDGLPDMKDPSGERFEEERTKKFFMELYSVPQEKLNDHISQTVASWCAEARLPDDVTLIDIRF